MKKQTKHKQAGPVPALVTPKQSARAKRNEAIKFDYNTQVKIHGSSRMAVAEYVAQKHKVSLATVFRCVK